MFQSAYDPGTQPPRRPTAFGMGYIDHRDEYVEELEGLRRFGCPRVTYVEHTWGEWQDQGDVVVRRCTGCGFGEQRARGGSGA
jgi:hypothetical protein